MTSGDEVAHFFRFVLFMLLAGGWWSLARMLPASLWARRQDTFEATQGWSLALRINPHSLGNSALELRVLIPLLLVYALFIYGGLFHSGWLSWLLVEPD